MLPEQFGNGQYQIGGSDAFTQLTGQIYADHVRSQEVDWLAKHAGLGFNTADAPADHADAVNHGGVRIGAD